MRSHEMFRRKLRHRLLQIAEARRRAAAGRPSGTDLKVIARCETLAASALTLDPGLCTALDHLRTDPAAARRFAALWAALPDAFAVTLWPDDAAELTVWLIRQAAPVTALSRRVRLAATAGGGAEQGLGLKPNGSMRLAS